MKKKIAFMLALVTITAGTITAFAEANNVDEPTKIKVTGSYYDSKYTTVSVDVSWDEMEFTYFGGHRFWNPEDHTYYTTSQGWWSEEKAITVTNHSNTDIQAQLSFNSAIDGLQGNFDKNVLDIATAEGTTVEEAPKGISKFSVSGTGIETSGTELGTITVTIQEKT